MLGSQPLPQGLVRHVLRPIDEDRHEAPVRVVEGQFDRHAVGITAELPGVVVQERVHVITLLEHPSRGVECIHLSQGPSVPSEEGVVSSPSSREQL